MKAYQQGDLLLIRRRALPADALAKPASKGRHVLAEGEHTGHAHAVEEAPGIELLERDGVLWLRVEGVAATVTHEEHKPQVVTPGIYEVRRVVELDPFQNEVRTVAD